MAQLLRFSHASPTSKRTRRPAAARLEMIAPCERRLVNSFIQDVQILALNRPVAMRVMATLAHRLARKVRHEQTS